MKKILLALILFFSASAAMAEVAFNAAIVPDVAIHPRTTRIDGVTLSIYGENETHGFNMGFVNGTTGSSEGMMFGIVNYSDNYFGVNLGLVNFVKGTFRGLQWGGVNYAENMNGGLQVGVVNFVRHATSCFQVGIINIISDNTQFFTDAQHGLAPAMVIVNWRFL